MTTGYKVIALSTEELNVLIAALELFEAEQLATDCPYKSLETLRKRLERERATIKG